jgi:hypothetical protein
LMTDQVFIASSPVMRVLVNVYDGLIGLCVSRRKKRKRAASAG